MTIPTRCPRCHEKYDLKDDYAGKKVRCPKCNQTILVSSPTPQVTPRTPIPPVPPVRDTREEPWETPEPETSTTESNVSDESNGRETGRTSSLISLTFLADFAFDRMKITYALQWGALTVIGLTLSGLMARYLSVSLGGLVALVYLWTCLMGITGGVAYLSSRKLANGKAPHWSSAWSFFTQQALSLIVGTLSMGLLVVVAATFIFGGIFALGMIPWLGPILGGIMVIPTLVILLVAIGLFMNLYLLPIIIGVEEVGAWNAFQIIRRLVLNGGFGLFIRYLQAASLTLFFAILVGVVVFGALFGAVAICAGGGMFGILSNGIESLSGTSLLYLISILSVVATYVAFLSVLGSTSYTMVYCECAGQSRADD